MSPVKSLAPSGVAEPIKLIVGSAYDPCRTVIVGVVMPYLFRTPESVNDVFVSICHT